MTGPRTDQGNSALSVLHEGIEIKQLEGWVTFPDAAAILGMTRYGIGYIVWKARVFDFDNDIRVVGSGGAATGGGGKMFVIRQTALMAVKKSRDAGVRLEAEQKRSPASRWADA